MRNNNYNLVVLHHDEVFATREEAMNYLLDFYKPNSLDAEPVFVKYGEERNPNVILAFGTSSNAPGSFYAIDMAKTEEQMDYLTEVVENSQDELEFVTNAVNEIIESTGLTFDDNKITDKISYEPDSRDNVIGTAESLAQAIDLLSKYAQQNEITFEDSDSVTFVYEVNPNGGKKLKATVNISRNGDADGVTFNNNIIGIKNDGLYAASHLAYDDVRHELIFTTSGYKNGRYMDDAVVQKVNLGQHTKLIADNDGKTVRIAISESEDTYTTTLSADLQIADRENNILKVADGRVYVDGTAKNIKYGESTVAATLTAHKNRLDAVENVAAGATKSAHIEGDQTDTFETVVSTLADGGAKISGNVRLGAENSIVVRNGGLEANISIDVDTATNKLIVNIGNESYTRPLPGVELFESAEYNDANEELIITFRTGNTLVIPIHGIIHTWQTVNQDTSAIVLTKTVVTGGVDTLTGDVKLRSNDNLITKDNAGRLYVSEYNINNKVNAEAQRAQTAEQEIRDSIQTLSNNTSEQFSEISERITNTNDALTQETTRAREAENQIRATANHADETATQNKEDITALNETISDLRTDLNTEITERTNKDTELQGKISAAETAIITETTRATTAESAINDSIAELSDRIGEGSEQTLETAKQYTDTKVTAEKTERQAQDVVLDNKITTLETKHDNELANAIHTASDDATAKANAAKAEANTYTDTKVAAETARATAAEQANAASVTALATEVDKKVETVEIVKNSQSDLQYILKVDGNDVSEINIPKDQFLKSVSYNPTTKEFTFEFETTTGTVTTVVRLDDLVDTYTAGDGLTLTGNKFAVRINEDSEAYLTVSEEGIKLLGVNAKIAEAIETANVYTNTAVEQLEREISQSSQDTETIVQSAVNAEAQRAQSAEQELRNALTSETSRATAAETNNANAIAAETTRATAAEQANATAISDETARATAAEQANATAISEEATRAQLAEQTNANAITNETTRAIAAEQANATAVETEKQRAMAAEAVNANAITAETTRATAAEQANANAIASEVTRATAAEQENAMAISAERQRATAAEQANANAISALETDLNDMKFVTEETDTVKMTMVKETGADTRVLSSDVKIKTIPGNVDTNIIKSDENGLYATVTLSYDKAANKLTFNDGNGDKSFELNNFGILQDAFYDSESESIVLIVKKDDESTERITVPVSGLVNTWTVENNADSPIILSKETREDGDVLSANVSILNNSNNLLVNENGSLFVDADSNVHKALWGTEEITVQGAINILKERTDEIEGMKEDIDDLKDQITIIINNIEGYQADLSALEQRVERNEGDIQILFGNINTLNREVGELSVKVDFIDNKVEGALEQIANALEIINQYGDRISRIEAILEQLIDFGWVEDRN